MPFKDKEAQRAYRRGYMKRYLSDPKNRALHMARVRKNNDIGRAERALLTKKLKQVPCADCKGCFDPVCMDFDHVRGEKLGNVSSFVSGSRGNARILNEIAKCDVVCANCHRLRTKARMIARKNEA